jgi:hypothetical protein
LQLFQVDAVHYFFGGTHQILEDEGLGDEIFDAVGERAKFFFDLGAAGHEEKRDVAGLFSPAQFFEELAPIETGHFVIAENGVGRLVNDFQKGIGAIIGENDFAMGVHAFFDQVADKGIVLGDEQANRFGGSGGHFFPGVCKYKPRTP